MAEETAQERQHSATSKRLVELRKQGTVMRSRDLSGGLIFIVTIIVLAFMTLKLRKMITKDFLFSYSHFNEVINNSDNLLYIIKHTFETNFYQILPILIIIFIVTLLTPFLFGGWNFTLDVIKFKFSKMNPINNLSRIFSVKNSFMEIIRSFFKSTFLFIVLVFYIYSIRHQLFNLMNEPINNVIVETYEIVKSYIFILSASLIFIVLFDLAYHYYQFQEKSKMSTQEVKDENKESEGNQETKKKIRIKQLIMLKQRLSQTVPKANVVITNPTHYAVALRYDSNKDHAPKVVAKGKSLIAHQIKQIAIAHAVTIYEAPELARAIYHTTKMGATIHPALYKAVAIVLSYVYQLKNYQMGKANYPVFTSNLEIPEEFIYKE